MNSTLRDHVGLIVFVGLNLFGLPGQPGRMNSTLQEDRWFFVGPNLFGRRGWGVRLFGRMNSTLRFIFVVGIQQGREMKFLVL